MLRNGSVLPERGRKDVAHPDGAPVPGAMCSVDFCFFMTHGCVARQTGSHSLSSITRFDERQKIEASHADSCRNNVARGAGSLCVITHRRGSYPGAAQSSHVASVRQRTDCRTTFDHRRAVSIRRRTGLMSGAPMHRRLTRGHDFIGWIEAVHHPHSGAIHPNHEWSISRWHAGLTRTFRASNRM